MSVLVAAGLVSNTAKQSELPLQMKTVVEVKQEIHKLDDTQPKTKNEQKSEIVKTKKEIKEVQLETEVIRRRAPEEESQKQHEEPVRQSEQQVTQPKLSEQNPLFCNGRDWLPCLPGNQFYCPTSGDAQCVFENMQPTQSPSSRLDEAKNCIQRAMEQHRVARDRAEANRKQCEAEHNNPALGTTDSIVCMIRGSGVPEPASYLSDCIGSSRAPSSEPSPSPTFPISRPEVPSFSEQMRQMEICDLVDGTFLNGKCH